MKLHFLDYRYAGSVLEHTDFKVAKEAIVHLLSEQDVPLLKPQELNPKLGGVKRRSRKPLKGSTRERFFLLLVDQKQLNKQLDAGFKSLGWVPQPAIVGKDREEGPQTGLKGDFKKGRLQVEIQFGNLARWYTDVFKFQLSYSLDVIDVAVLVVPLQGFANLIDENIAYFERVSRELPWAKMSLMLPIWVIGVEPDDYQPVRAAYDEAAVCLVAQQFTNGKPIDVIPFSERLTTEEAEELD